MGATKHEYLYLDSDQSRLNNMSPEQRLYQNKFTIDLRKHWH